MPAYAVAEHSGSLNPLIESSVDIQGAEEGSVSENRSSPSSGGASQRSAKQNKKTAS
jgi:hypothetical protein